MNFEDFSLNESLMEGIDAMGYKTASPVQQQAIPLILEGKDVIACAQTGTGKTAAYLLPTIHRIMAKPQKEVSTLIIAPTRELALQIDQQIEALSYFCSVSSIAVYGGGDGISWEQQKRALKSGTEIITATPGRLIAMLSTEGISFDKLECLILDEADRMLDMGFSEDIERIISHLPKERQTLLFSATMPPKIMQLARKILQEPEIINIAISKPAEKIDQQAYSIYDDQKGPLLQQILFSKNFASVIIFAATKESVKQLGRQLSGKKLKVAAFHSDLDQQEREKIMQTFKSGQLNVLVGTDILSRGIDVEGIDLVVNYDVPGDPEDYIHRIGRTARAAADGTAITFINPKDQERFRRIEHLMGKEVRQVDLPEDIGKGPVYSSEAPPKRQGNKPKGNYQQKKRRPQNTQSNDASRPEDKSNKQKRYKKFRKPRPPKQGD